MREVDKELIVCRPVIAAGDVTHLCLPAYETSEQGFEDTAVPGAARHRQRVGMNGDYGWLTGLDRAAA